MTGRKGPTLLAVATALLLAACATERVPLEADPGLGRGDIDRVLLLPAVDARPSRFDQVQVSRNVGDAMLRYLRERGYPAIAAESFRVRPKDRLALRTATAAELEPLAPEGERYFVVVQVERLEPTWDENGRTYDAQLTAALVDSEAHRVLWRDVATASGNLSGVLTMLSRTTVQYEAAINAARALVASLPDRSGRR